MTMLDRRAFLAKLASGTGLAWLGERTCTPLFASEARPAAQLFASIGACTTPDKAAAVLSAGGQHIEPSVTDFLIPDKPDAAWAKNLEAAKASPLPVVACNCFLPASLRCTGPATHHDAILKWADIAFSRARQLGIDRIVFGSSGSRKVPDGFSKDQAKAQFVDLLRHLAPLAAEHGVVIAVEPLRREEDNFINTVIGGAWFVEQVNHPNMRLLADLYHMLCNGESPGDLRKVGRLLCHAHIAEKEGRAAPGAHGDDFRPFFRALREVGYADRLSVEGNWDTAQLPKAFETIREQAEAFS
jgi:sugar phosphate isomerase/epimerase